MPIVPANRHSIGRAAAILRGGGLVAIPTETVYGLGANAADDNAVAGIFAAKARPRFNPLIVHVRNLEHAQTLAGFSPLAFRLAEAFWPGPLTLVLPRRVHAPVSLLATGGLETIALRVPAHRTARALLEESQLGIAAPSANRSGTISSTSATQAAENLGEAVDLILDAGPAEHGIESTIVGLYGAAPVLLRPGAVAREEIEGIIGLLGIDAGHAIAAPGQLRSHYAPNTPLRLNAQGAAADEALLAFGTPPAQVPVMRNLSETGDLREAAANLFSMLHEPSCRSPSAAWARPSMTACAVPPRRKTTKMVSPKVIADLKAIVGESGYAEDPDEIAPHLVEWRGTWRGHSPLLLKPQTTAEISAILSLCNETRTPVVPQGGNTGLVGGQIPLAGEVVLHLGRMNRIRSMDSSTMSAIVEAGVVLAALQRAADAAGAYFPLSLAAEGSATIGGTLSTNAGGVNVLRYGSARALALGLEVVLADGRVLDMLRVLHKDNTGYDLKQLFIGAEGTLGVIAAAVLKLFPKPETAATALIACPTPEAAVALLRGLQKATGGLLSAFEFFSRTGLELVLAHIPQTRDPFALPSPWYVLVEAGGGKAIPLADIVQTALASAIEEGMATNATVATSQAQRTALWRLRESFSEAQKREGASLKHDVSAPVDAIPELIARGSAAVEALVPEIRPVPFGHLGDGNVHFNFSAPKNADARSFLSRRAEIARVVHDLVASLGGSISAEHGLGVMKRDEILRYKSAAELDTMRALKRTLDPNNILNPGKVLTV
jgi:tRNA threonylcarbamoyl adenosine modification protein (Sua5/YciO/YrdC/YwlC family)